MYGGLSHEVLHDRYIQEALRITILIKLLTPITILELAAVADDM